MKKLIAVIIVLWSFMGVACNNDSDVSAPGSLKGKTYNATVVSGSGLYATTGTWTMKFSDTDMTYIVTGDRANVADSAGTYTYTAKDKEGSIDIDDSLSGKGKFLLIYDTETSGTYQGTTELDNASSQLGTFVEAK